MSDITLTLALNEKRPHDFSTFAFTRDQFGKGYWISRSKIGNQPPNCIVHVQLQSELTALAKARGLSEAFNFAAQKPKPKKEKTVRTRGPRKPKSPTAGLIGGFNPFAGGA